MLGKYLRSVPSRRMSVRAPRIPSMSKPAVHKSFRLTRPEKEKFIKSGFGSYTPESFKKTLKEKDPRQAETKAEAYFLKHAQSEKTLSTQEQMKQFTKGFLEEAHEEGAKLRSGFNPRHGESEQAKRLLKEYKQKVSTPDTPKPSRADEHRANQSRLSGMRERLGIQHGTPAPGAQAIQEPTPLAGHGWTGPGKTHDATTPSQTATPHRSTPTLAPSVSGFTGGRITQIGSAGPSPSQAAPSIGPSGPVITEPKEGERVSGPVTIHGQAGAGHLLHIYLDGQPEATHDIPKYPPGHVDFEVPITKHLLAGEHVVMIAEYQGQIRIGLSRPVSFQVMSEPHHPTRISRSDLADPSGVVELPI